MDTKKFLLNLSKNWKNILIITVILVILTLILSLTQSLKYRSSTRLLVVQEYSGIADPYVASRSTQYLSNILAEIVYSTSFFNEVMKSGFNIDDNFSKNKQKRKKQWKKMINTRVINNTGIIVINVYNKNQWQAEQIAKAVSYTLRTKHSRYHGGGSKVLIKVIDEPITSNYPVKPNLVVSFILSLIFGLILGIAFVYFYPDYKIRLWKKKEKFAGSLKINNDQNNKINKKVENKWKSVGNIIENKNNIPGFSPEFSTNFASESAEAAQERKYSETEEEEKKILELHRRKEVERKIDSNFDFNERKENNLENNNNFNNNQNIAGKKSEYEKIVKNGNIKNIFGHSDRNNY